MLDMQKIKQCKKQVKFTKEFSSTDDHSDDLAELGELLKSERTVALELSNAMLDVKTIVLRGIPEDFKIFFENDRVCEVVYGRLYNENYSLLKLLMNYLPQKP